MFYTRHAAVILSVIITATLAHATQATQATENSVAAIVARAGNTECEATRYHILKSLRQNSSTESLYNDLDILLPVIDWWVNGRQKLIDGTGGELAELGYLYHFFYRKAKPGNDWPGKISKDSPLYPLWAYYRARALMWEAMELWNHYHNPKVRKRWHDEVSQLFTTAANAYPRNRIIAMYTGTPMPWESDFQDDPDAPQWANLQRQGLEKLTDMIHWWIDNRQAPDGQYGGGWDDDVEMWRFWTPILVGFHDPKIVSAQSRLSHAMLSRPHMSHGYTSTLFDVEHTAEETSDAITPMIFLEPDNPEWAARTQKIIELAQKHWMARNNRGQLQFKSTYFSATQVDPAPERACDTVYHPRALHPALIYWLRNSDETVGNLICRWMDTWVDASMRQERGKPAGVIPSAIHFPSGNVGGTGKLWWQPKNYPTNMYDWPSAMILMTRTMLLTYHMTGNEKYLEPMHAMARIRMKYLDSPADKTFEPGSAGWCATNGGRNGNGMRSFLGDILSKYRLLTGDTQYDTLLQADANGYTRMRIGEGIDAIIRDLRRNAQAFSMNKPAYTSEVRFTDRVLYFNRRWANEANGHNWPTPYPHVLYYTTTGDSGDPRYFPMNAVQWLIQARGFAALVTDSGRNIFRAEVYNFLDKPRLVPAQLCLLSKGTYHLTVQDADGTQLENRELAVTSPRTRIELTLPPKMLCHICITP